MDIENDKAGDTAQGTEKEGSEPKYATLEEVTTAVSEMINKAITSRNKQVESKVEKMLVDLSTKMEEKFKLFEPKSEDPAVKDKTDPKDTKSAPEETAAMKALQKQLADVQSKLEATEKEKKAARDRARDKDLRQMLADELVKSGIDPARVKHAVGLLVDSEKSVRYVADDTDDISFKFDNEDVDLKTGIKNWLKSDDAKIYMPPRGTTGAGGNRTLERRPQQQGNNILEELGNSIAEAVRRGEL